MSNNPARTAIKEAPLTPKHQTAPHVARIRPAAAGPITLAKLNMVAFRAIAFGRSARSSMISMVKDWRAGASTEFTTPSKAAITNTCQTSSRPTARSSISMKARSMEAVCVYNRMDRRGTLSASTPAGSIRKKVGRLPAKATAPSRNFEPVIS